MLSGMKTPATYTKNLYRLPLALTTQHICLERHLSDLMAIENACFPGQMQECEKNFREFFSSEYSAGLILYHDEKPIGYFSGTHICEEYAADLIASFPEVAEAQDVTFYLESIAILDEYRSITAVDILIHDLACFLRQFDYQYCVMHVRQKHGLDRLARLRYRARKLKTYDNWFGFDEPFAAMWVEVDKVPVLPRPARKVYSLLRRLRRKFLNLSGGKTTQPAAGRKAEC